MKSGFSVLKTGKYSFLMCTMWLQILYLETVFLTNNYLFIIDTIDRDDLLGQTVLCFYKGGTLPFATESYLLVCSSEMPSTGFLYPELEFKGS